MKPIAGLVAFVVAIPLSAAPASAQTADSVCFGSPSRGIACLNDGKFEPYTTQSARLPSNNAVNMIACGNRIVAVLAGGVVSFDGQAWSAPNRPPGGFAGRIACAGAGTYWVTMTSGVAHWDGAGWKTYATKDIVGDTGASAVFDVAVGPDGLVWVVFGSGVVARLEGGNWTAFKEGRGFEKRYPLLRIYTDAKGQVWLPAGAAVLTFRDGKFQPIPRIPNIGAIAFGRDGKTWIGSGTWLISVEGDRLTQFNFGATIRGVAVDADGFVWVASVFGIARFADGKFEPRRMDNSAVPDNDYASVAALGKGSPLPPAADQPAGSLVGRLEWTDGKPVAGAEMQICGTAAALLSGTEGPCGKRPLFQQTVTEADGKFSFAKTLPASYRMAVKPVGATRWIVFLGGTDRLRVERGEAKNAGTLTMDTRNRPQ